MNWVKGKAATKHATVVAGGSSWVKCPPCLMPDRPDRIDTCIRQDSVGNFSSRGIAWGGGQTGHRSLPPLSGALHVSHHLHLEYPTSLTQEDQLYHQPCGGAAKGVSVTPSIDLAIARALSHFRSGRAYYDERTWELRFTTLHVRTTTTRCASASRPRNRCVLS